MRRTPRTDPGLFKEKGKMGLIEFRSGDLREWLLVRNGAIIAAYS